MRKVVILSLGLFLTSISMSVSYASQAHTVQSNAVEKVVQYVTYLHLNDGSVIYVGTYSTSWEAQAAGKQALINAGGPPAGYYTVDSN